MNAVATTEQGRSILQEKVNSKIAQYEERTVATLDRYQGDVENLRDYIVPLGKGGRIEYTANGHVNVIESSKTVTGERTPDHVWTLHPHASEQLGERLGIPGTFVRDQVAGSEWQRAAVADLLSAHTANTDRQRLLFRAVGDELRGVLSDQYKRLDSLRILRTVWEEATQAGAKPVDAHYTDTRMYAEFLNPQIVSIPTANNGVRHQAFGLRVQNSDFGDGALDVRFYMIEAVCFNGAVAQSAFRQVHLGSRLPDNLELSERTYRLETGATTSLVKDVTRNLLSTAKIREQIDAIQRASAQVIDIDAEMRKLTKGVLSKGEAEEVVRLLSNSREEDGLTGSATRFKLSQAIGSLAHKVTPTRAREMQELAGALIDRKEGKN